MEEDEKKLDKFVKKIEEAIPEEIDKQQAEIMQKTIATIETQKYYGDEEVVTYQYDELTGVCPMTGIQDTYKITIQFIPDKLIPELKSLRFYFLAFRDIPIFHEHLESKIYRDFYQAILPKKLTVHIDVAMRGGIHTIIDKFTSITQITKDKSLKEFEQK
mgnify:CR=1 FL=1